METQEKNLEELKRKYSGMLFEWIKGDLTGTTNVYKEIKQIGENFFIEFIEGGRINEDLVEEYTLFYPAPPQLQPVDSGVPINEKSSTVTSIVYSDSSSPVNPDSAVYTLLKKQKKNMVEVSIKIELNLPSKNLYDVLSSSFEDAENEIIKFVLDGVDIENIKKSLSESVKENYYSVKPSPKKNSESIKINKEKETNEQ